MKWVDCLLGLSSHNGVFSEDRQASHLQQQLVTAVPLMRCNPSVLLHTYRFSSMVKYVTRINGSPVRYGYPCLNIELQIVYNCRGVLKHVSDLRRKLGHRVDWWQRLVAVLFIQGFYIVDIVGGDKHSSQAGGRRCSRKELEQLRQLWFARVLVFSYC